MEQTLKVTVPKQLLVKYIVNMTAQAPALEADGSVGPGIHNQAVSVPLEGEAV